MAFSEPNRVIAFLTCKTLIEPLLGEGPGPAWSDIRRTVPNYIGVNVMLTDKIEPLSSATATAKFPSRKAFEKMAAEELHGLIRLAALRVMKLLYKPDVEGLKQIKALGLDWFRFDEGFLRRYRLDALQDLCKKLGDRKVVPIKVGAGD